MLTTPLRKKETEVQELGSHPSKSQEDKGIKWGQRCDMGKVSPLE